MFTSRNITVTVAGARLHQTPADDEPLTIIETNLLIEPWPSSLLGELGPEAFAHVFLPDGRVKPELRDVKIRPVGGRLQRMTFALASDGAGAAVLDPAIVQWLKFTRRENEKKGIVHVRGIIRVDFEFRDKAVREFFAKRFGQTVYLTAVSLEGRLNFEAPTPAATPPPGAPPVPDAAAGDVLDEPTRQAGGRVLDGPGAKKKPDVH